MNRMLWICSLLAVLLHLGPSPARAQVPAFMPLQGFLTDTAGAPITGATDVTVSFYSVDVAGASLHTESQTVEVQDGYFTLYVGDVTPLDATLFRDQRTLFVGLQLPGEAEMTPRFQLGTVPYAGFAAFAGAVSFDDVTDIPAGLLDGDDVGPTYGAGEGITIAGTSIAVDRATTQARVSGACAAGSAIRAIEPDGTVTCETRTAPSYLAGTGLLLTGTTFAANTAVLQARVAGACGSGQAVTAINADGSVVCTATGALHLAGTGLDLTGTTFSVDTTTVQRRVNGSCPDGSISAIAEDGSVTCAPSGTHAAQIRTWTGDVSPSNLIPQLLPGSSTTISTNGHDLLISLQVGWSVTAGTSCPDVSCQPIIDGRGAATFSGATEDPFSEGLLTGCRSLGSFHRWVSTRIYRGIPAGTHTISVQCTASLYGSAVRMCTVPQHCDWSLIEM